MILKSPNNLNLGSSKNFSEYVIVVFFMNNSTFQHYELGYYNCTSNFCLTLLEESAVNLQRGQQTAKS